MNKIIFFQITNNFHLDTLQVMEYSFYFFLTANHSQRSWPKNLDSLLNVIVIIVKLSNKSICVNNRIWKNVINRKIHIKFIPKSRERREKIIMKKLNMNPNL